MKFCGHFRGCGGGGAIDLVVHARGCSPSAAVRRLASVPPPARPKEAQDAAAGGRFVPPRPCGGAWPQVRGWLASPRGLNRRLIDALHQRGLVFVDAWRNAVFLCRSAGGEVTGADLAGTRPRLDGSRFHGLARGSRRAAEGFWIEAGEGRLRPRLRQAIS